jgi:uncharacterized protein DUF1761
MLDLQVQWIPVVVGMAADMALGLVWFSLPVLGRPWMKETGKTTQQAKQGGSNVMPYVGAAAGAFVVSFLIAILIENLVVADLSDALLLAAFLWLAFFAAPTLVHYAFEGRSPRLYAIYAGNQLVGFLLAAAIYYLWPVA